MPGKLTLDAVSNAVKNIVAGDVVVKLNEMDKRLTSQINELDRRLTSQIESLRNEVKADIQRVDERVDSLRNELKADIKSVDNRIESLSKAIDLTKEVERLKIEVEALKERRA